MASIWDLAGRDHSHWIVGCLSPLVSQSLRKLGSLQEILRPADAHANTFSAPRGAIAEGAIINTEAAVRELLNRRAITDGIQWWAKVLSPPSNLTQLPDPRADGSSASVLRGPDLSEGELPAPDHDEAGGGPLLPSMDAHFHPAIRAVYDCDAPTVSRINGVIAGGGLGLAFACDISITARSAFLPPASGRCWGSVQISGQRGN